MRLLIDALPVVKDERVLAAFGHAEDAAVYRLDDERAIVATIDVITPIVDDPATYGAIAAINSLSDVYAMGGRPLVALSFIGAPSGLPVDVLVDIARGGAQAALAQGAPVLGGHSVESRDLMYGLAVIGEVHPQRLFRNDALQPGDQLVLTKPLGTGTLTTAVRADKLGDADIQHAVDGMLTSNGGAVEPLHAAGVVAVTDITGFGLLGHAAELARASEVRLLIEQSAVPEYPRSREMLEKKQRTRGNRINFEYAQSLGPLDGDPEPLLRDPQTSGGLLCGVGPERLDDLLAGLQAAGYPRATRIGEVQTGAGLAVR